MDRTGFVVNEAARGALYPSGAKGGLAGGPTYVSHVDPVLFGSTWSPTGVGLQLVWLGWCADPGALPGS